MDDATRQPEPQEDPGRRLSRRDIMGVFWRYLFWFQSGWNYERYQGLGYAHAMKPVLKKLYPDKQDRRQAVETHLEFFNTTPFMAAPILGANVALEENSEAGARKEIVTSIKTGMMGPFAGIGDSLFLAIYFPIIFSIGASMAQQGNVLGPLLVALFTLVPVTLFRYWAFWQGYKQGTQLAVQMAGGLLRKLTDGAAILGLVVAGALVTTFVQTEVAFVFESGGAEVSVQEEIDAILPSLVPVLFVGLMYWMLSRRWSPTILIFVLLALGVGLSAAGVLAMPE